MAGQTFTVRTEGLDLLHQRLDSRRLLRPTKDFIERAGTAAHRTAQRAAKPHPGDKGTLGRAITIEFSDGGKTATVAPIKRIMGIANTIEEGRRPGRRPPYKPIKMWLSRHGAAVDVRGGSKIVRQVRDTIRAEGTKGVHFMAQAEEVAQRALRDGVPETEHDIRNMWERGH